jgi:integrase
LTEGSKNLATVDTTRQSQQNQAAGATTLDEATIKGKLVEFAFFLKKEGYRPSTIKGKLENVKCLISYGAGPYLLNPEKVKEIIAERSNWGDGYKANVVDAYTSFLTMHRMTWKPPRYSRPETLPWIPLEKELDTLVRTTGKRMSIFLQGLKETGVDPGELNAIRWIDINPQTRTIAINYPVKGHRPRILDVSRELIDRLNTLPKVSERVFQGNPYSIRRNFHDQRQVAARKFNNPRLLKITFITFRHWKATMEYHKTKDILWVMKLLGHHSLKSTLIYIDLEKAAFKETNDEFTVKVADTLDEACKLLEVGFEYITDMEGKKLFRKRK